MQKYDVKAKWTGSFPNLCSGSWEISINGKFLSGLGSDNMNTLGTYSSWHFEDWNEVFEDYSDGSAFEDWKEALPNNLEMSLRLSGFSPKNEELLLALYREISSIDWRSSSCGGCI